MADFFAKEIDYKGERCVELSAGNFYALICPAMGANVLRLRDNQRGMEIFRFDENEPMETYKNSPEVYGFPTLYFPNRLSHGKLKTSDGEYELPCNEGFPFFNCLHGFLHKREYNLVRLSTEGDIAAAKFEYIYDDNDEMFQCFLLPFRLEIVYTLGVKELEQFYIGEAIKKARISKNLTQEELGARIGVKKSQISRIEKGHNITLSNLSRLFRAMNMNIKMFYI